MNVYRSAGLLIFRLPFFLTFVPSFLWPFFTFSNLPSPSFLHHTTSYSYTAMTEEAPLSSSSHINIQKAPLDAGTQDHQDLTPNTRRRLGLFPRTNSQKWLHKSHLTTQRHRRWHKRSAEPGGLTHDDFPFDPTKLVIRFTLSGAKQLTLNEVSLCNDMGDSY